jgi:hypothetical protein
MEIVLEISSGRWGNLARPESAIRPHRIISAVLNHSLAIVRHANRTREHWRQGCGLESRIFTLQKHSRAARELAQQELLVDIKWRSLKWQ